MELDAPSLSSEHSESKSGKSLSFVIRPYDSCTARLRDHAHKSPSGVAPVPLLLEGPYGTAMHLSKFDRVVFVVGGTGITIALPYLRQLHAQSSKSKQDVHIIWSAGQVGILDAVMHKQKLAAYLAYLHGRQLRVDVYQTSEDHDITVTKKYVGATEPSLKPSSNEDISVKLPGQVSAQEIQNMQSRGSRGLTIHSGRPVLDAIIQHLVAPDHDSLRKTKGIPVNEQKLGGRICVVSCGPPAMSDVTRKAVVDILGLSSRPDVEFLDEGFAW